MGLSEITRLTAALWIFCNSVYGSNKEPNMVPGRSVIVHLFEWRFDDIAEECETFLGPRGYGGVQYVAVFAAGVPVAGLRESFALSDGIREAAPSPDLPLSDGICAVAPSPDLPETACWDLTNIVERHLQHHQCAAATSTSSRPDRIRPSIEHYHCSGHGSAMERTAKGLRTCLFVLQTSPVNEHGIVFGEPVKRPWYERYQPVSYKIGTRSGNETQFRDMVRRCNEAGVRVYVDVVINHMSGPLQIKKGTAGSSFNYDEFSYPAVPYGPNDFNRKEKCNSESGTIEIYGDALQVRNCELVGLRDLDHGKDHVRAKISEFLNRLISFGVAGFRVDAAKHMWPVDLKVIYGKLNNLSTEFFPVGSKPFIYQEVIDMGHGEPITRWEYIPMGRVTEFLYGAKLGEVLRKRPNQLLKYLRNFGEGWGFLPGGDALTFVDNHDNQRGHGAGGADILTFFEPRLYKMAIAFMLAWPYGLPRVMSSYHWPRDFRSGVDQNAWFGPPSDAAWNIRHVVRRSDNTCGGGWICEHRWRQIYNLVELHNVAGFSPVTNWWDNGYHAIAFGRGNATFVAINNEDFRLDAVLQTSLPQGRYCDVISGIMTSSGCTGRSFVVGPDGKLNITVDHSWEDPVIALHVQAKLPST